MASKLNRFTILGQFIKEKREALGITQQKLGMQLGYKGGQYVYFVETGKINIPRRNIKKWLKLLKITPHEYIRMEKMAVELELFEVLGVSQPKAQRARAK